MRYPTQLFTVVCALFFAGGPLGAQNLDVQADAISGESFGVVRIRLPAAPLATFESTPKITLDDPQQRVHYTAVRRLEVPVRLGLDPPPPGGPQVGGGRLLSRLGRLIQAATEDDPVQTVGYEVLALFSGEGPLQLSVGGPVSAELTATPRAGSVTETRAALMQWWSVYREMHEARIAQADYPPVVETYLLYSLARRLGLPIDTPQMDRENITITDALHLLSGAEHMRTRMLALVASGQLRHDAAGPAELPLPEPPRIRPPSIPESLAPVDVEPLATRVPADCFYLRFGSFNNYLWFQDLSAEHGGDISRMLTLRGVDYAGSRRVQQRLRLQTTQLSRMMGPSVVEDQALIGDDLLLSSGAAIGVLMKAKSPALLAASLQRDRQAALGSVSGAQLRDLKIAGHPVTLLETPDHRLRSFLVQDGDYFLVTTSRSLAERFLNVGDGAPALSQLPEFQAVRTRISADRPLTVFGYLSSTFLTKLVGPQYQIELRRRMLAEADVRAVQLARLAAASEGLPPDASLDQLVAAGFLPPGFGVRSDGAGPIITEDTVIDSMRGAPGNFLPVSDVPVEGVTAEEAAWYARRSAFFDESWREMDPLLLAVERTASDRPGIDRLELHVEVAPLVPEKYGWIGRQLGPPTSVAIQFAPDDLVTVQAHVVSDQLGGTIPPHHLFVGIKDGYPPRPESVDGLLSSYLALQTVPGYLGAWPQPGLLDRLPLGLGSGRPVGPATSRLIGGLHRYQADGFSVVSFQPDVLAASTPYLATHRADDEAQVRIRIDDLQDRALADWINTQAYARTFETSVAGAKLLEALTTQLQVPTAEAREVATSLLGGELQCPLGGEYVFVEKDDRPARWQSTAWTRLADPYDPPADYKSPLLTWFRGGAANVTQYSDRLVAAATLHVERTRE